MVSRNSKVGSLIDPTCGVWDTEFLKPFMSMEEYEAILAIHIGDPEL